MEGSQTQPLFSSKASYVALYPLGFVPDGVFQNELDDILSIFVNYSRWQFVANRYNRYEKLFL